MFLYDLYGISCELTDQWTLATAYNLLPGDGHVSISVAKGKSYLPN
jgi:hypothetical protein